MLTRLLVQGGSCQEGELVRVLTGRGHTHCSRPIVVQVSELVGQPLQLVGGEAALIHDDVVAGGVDSALPHRLGDEEEVVSVSYKYYVFYSF